MSGFIKKMLGLAALTSAEICSQGAAHAGTINDFIPPAPATSNIVDFTSSANGSPYYLSYFTIEGTTTLGCAISPTPFPFESDAGGGPLCELGSPLVTPASNVIGYRLDVTVDGIDTTGLSFIAFTCCANDPRPGSPGDGYDDGTSIDMSDITGVANFSTTWDLPYAGAIWSLEGIVSNFYVPCGFESAEWTATYNKLNGIGIEPLTLQQSRYEFSEPTGNPLDASVTINVYPILSNASATPTPEPGTNALVLLGIAFMGAGLIVVKRREAQAKPARVARPKISASTTLDS